VGRLAEKGLATDVLACPESNGRMRLIAGELLVGFASAFDAKRRAGGAHHPVPHRD